MTAQQACNIVCTQGKNVLKGKQRAIVLESLTKIEDGEQLLLFLEGPPGTGKSVVSNAIIRGQKLMGLHMWPVVEFTISWT